MSDSEDSDDQMRKMLEIKNEIDKCKRNPETSGMFVSGWDDADQDVDVVKNPKGIKTVYISSHAVHFCR